ncbi:MAG: UDP-glucose--hexose-1-phosphate uridylyltransferase [Candidatus Sumerlaeales bacterium]|nr:UDP-glucose--hexose-1-phosphate uridylyltransferase [Candidatus Sumerlaeales bacterium]
MNRLSENGHRRRNPLTGEWIMVSPHRLKRPWQGKVEATNTEVRPPYDPHCYLCPGNLRAGGAQTPNYSGTYVFNNDFTALLESNNDSPAETISIGAANGLMLARAESGICRVVCFSPRHDLTLAQMGTKEIESVVEAWVEQTGDLASKPFINYVQIFENKGAIMGCSNPHPHGQIWAQESIPTEPTKEDATQREYFAENKHTILSNYINAEIGLGEQSRIISANMSWVCLVPFWAKWPFEAMIVPRRPVAMMTDLNPEECKDLAEIVGDLTARYDNLFQVSFPYTMGIHQAYATGEKQPHWHLHFHFYPPLLRSAKVQKFMVGYEMMAEPQRDITPEQAAVKLRKLSNIHYSKVTDNEGEK